MSDPEFPNTLWPDAYFERGYTFASIDLEETQTYKSDDEVKEGAKAIAESLWPEDNSDSTRITVFITIVLTGYKCHKYVQRSIDKDKTKERYMKESFQAVQKFFR